VSDLGTACKDDEMVAQMTGCAGNSWGDSELEEREEFLMGCDGLAAGWRVT